MGRHRTGDASCVTCIPVAALCQEIPSISIRVGFRTVHLWVSSVAYCSEAFIDLSVSFNCISFKHFHFHIHDLHVIPSRVLFLAAEHALLPHGSRSRVTRFDLNITKELPHRPGRKKGFGGLHNCRHVCPHSDIKE